MGWRQQPFEIFWRPDHQRYHAHSRMLFVRAYPRETQEIVFDAHNRAFALFKGTCTRGIYDTMKTT